MRKIAATLTVVLFSTFQLVTPVFAAKGVVMTDTELDGVYAEGFNFSFGQAFLGNSVNNIAKSALPTNSTQSNPAAISTNNPNVQILSVSNSPTTAPSTSNTSSPTTTTDTGIAPMLNTPVNSPSPDASQTQSNPSTTSDVSPLNTITSVVPTTENTQSSGNNTTTTPLSTTSLTTNPLTAITNPTTNSPLVLDVTAGQGQNGQFNVNVNPINLPSSSSLSPINTSNNIVAVDGLSQQYLSALVNVNAAGSVVPVMLNINIFMNSPNATVTNSNGLNLSNYNTYNFQ